VVTVSASWGKPPPPRCDQAACKRTGRIAYAAVAAAYALFSCLLLMPYRLLFGALTLGALIVAVAAAGYVCPHGSDSGGLEDLIEATREDR
jgi:uncharacterized membrane protein YccC